MARIELNIVGLGDFSSISQQLKGLQLQVDAINKSIAGTALGSNLKNDLAAIQNQFKATLLSSGQFTASTVQLTSETEKFGKALQSGKLSLGQYFGIITGKSAEAKKSVEDLAVAQVRLNNSIVQQDITKQGVYSVYTPTTIDKVSKSVEIAAAKQNIFNLAIREGSQKLIDFGKNTQWAGRQLTVGLSMPMILFGSQAMKVFNDVNTELVRLQKVYGTGLEQPSKQALDAIKTQVTTLAQELARTMGIAAKDTAAMAADIAATGKTGNDLIVATREAMRLSKLGEIDTQKAMQATISLQNVYKLSTQQLSGAVDFLNAVENQTSTSLQDLVDGIPRVGPIVQQLGGSFKDTAVMMVAMKEAGVPAAQSANAIKSAIASLINPTKAAKEAFAAYNINLANIATSTGGNPVKMIMMLQGALKGLQPLAQAQLIEKLFGKFQEARIQALITNLGAVNSQTKTAFDLANASAPELASLAAAELKTANESTTGKFQRALQTIKADLLPIGQKIMEVATTLLNFGNSVSNVFNKIPGPIKMLLGSLLALGVIAGPIIMITGLFANLIGQVLRVGQSLWGLVDGSKKWQDLMTPAGVAAKAATEVFGTGLAENITAIETLNSAITRLTVNLEGMASAMNIGTGVSSILTAAETALAAEAGLAGGRIPFRAPGMASGGIVPGTGNSDSYPAMLMPGELVVPKAETQKYAPFLSAIMKGNLPGYAGGNYSEVLAHAAGPIDPNSEAGLRILASNPRIASIFASDPSKIQLLSKLVGTQTQGVNAAMRTSGASISEFESGWNQQKPLRFATAARSGGMSHTEMMNPEMQQSMKEFDAEVLKRVKSINKARIKDEDYYKIVGETIQDFKKMNGSSSRLAETLDNASKTYGGYRTQYSTQDLNAMLASGQARQVPGKTIIQNLSGATIGQRTKDNVVRGVSSNSYKSNSTIAAEIEQARLIAQEGAIAVDNAAKEALKEHSPSLKGEEVGSNYVKGMTQGIQKQSAVDQPWWYKSGETVTDKVGEGINSGPAQNRLQSAFTKAFGPSSRLASLRDTMMGRMGLGMGMTMAAQMASPLLSSIPGGGMISGAVTGAGIGASLPIPGGVAIGAAAGVVVSAFKSISDSVRQSENSMKASFQISSVAAQEFGVQITPLAQYDFAGTKDGLDKHIKSIQDNKAAVDQLTQAYISSKDQMVQDRLKSIQGMGPNELAFEMSKTYASTLTVTNDPTKAMKDIMSQMAAAKIDPSTMSYVKSQLPTYKNSVEALQGQLGYADKTFMPGIGPVGSLIPTKDARQVGSDYGPGFKKPVMPPRGVQVRDDTADKIATTLKNLTLSGTTQLDAISKSLDVAKIKAIDTDQVYNKFAKNVDAASPGFSTYADKFRKLGGSSIDLAKAVSLLNSQLVSAADIQKALASGTDALAELWNKNKAGLAAVTSAGAGAGAGGGGAGGISGTFSESAQQKSVKKLLEDRQKLENDSLKTLRDQLTAYQKQTAELKRQNDFKLAQSDLDNQAKEALISGNYLLAANIKQQIAGQQIDFNVQTAQGKMQDTLDSIQSNADKFATALADLNDAIANQSHAIPKNASELASKYGNSVVQSDRNLSKSINIPALVAAAGTGAIPNYTPSSVVVNNNISVNGATSSSSVAQVQKAAHDGTLAALKLNAAKNNKTMSVTVQGRS